MNSKRFSSFSLIYISLAILILVGLYLASLYSYLLFHSLVELATMIIAGGVFILAWNTHQFNVNVRLGHRE